VSIFFRAHRMSRDHWLTLLAARPAERVYLHHGAGDARHAPQHLYLDQQPYKQFFQLAPRFPGFYTRLEAEVELEPVQNWMKDSPWIPIVAVVLYLALCYFGPKLMASRKPYILRAPLVTWNFGLSVFSFIGAYRTVPHILYLLAYTPFRDTICSDPVATWGDGATGFWVQMFVLSKLPELGDTVFIVLKKKPLIFLHWYHHVTVLLFCWNSYVTESGSGLYFVAMNFTVHAIMYAYYGAMAARLPMKWFPSAILTSLQIIQMVIGIIVVVCSWYYVTTRGEKDPGCKNDPTNLYAGAIMYTSYLMLFVQFFVDKYIMKNSAVQATAHYYSQLAWFHLSPWWKRWIANVTTIQFWAASIVVVTNIGLFLSNKQTAHRYAVWFLPSLMSGALYICGGFYRASLSRKKPECAVV
jgi:elongation of very long chain fatty acids protein 6